MTVVLLSFVALLVGFGFALAIGWPRGETREGTLVVTMDGASGAAARTCTLADLVEGARAHALHVRTTPGGYEVVGHIGRPPFVVWVRVSDPARATLTTTTFLPVSAPTDVFPVALALVPSFGPLRLHVDGESFLIDGTLDQHALTREYSRRLTARARAAFRR